MRRLAATWLAKVLFVLLILSFAVWGIEDVVSNFGRDDAVARVRGEAIDAADAQEALRREIQRINQLLQGRFEPDRELRRNLAEQTVERLALDLVIRQEVQGVGVVVPDEFLRDYVFGIEGFRGPDGRFSRAQFVAFLRGNDLSEQGFINLLRDDLGRQQIASSVRAGATLPESAARALLAWEREQRSVTLVELPFADAPDPAEPAEADLTRFHENNPDLFSTPPYRRIAIATLNAERVMATIEVTDAEIENAYAAGRERFETPEQRRLQQALVQGREAADALAARWAAGASLEEIRTAATEAGGSASEIGLVTEARLPLPEIAAAAFALEPGAVSAPVESPFGWHVLRVAEIQPPERQELAAVRDVLRAEIQAERAADVAFERTGRIEDSLAARLSLAEIAATHDLGFAEVTLDAQGLTPDGTPAALPLADAARPEALRAVFAQDPNADLRLQEGPWGFMVVQVEEVIAPSLRPFAEVREAVQAAWLADARRRAQEARAAELLAAVQGLRPLAEAARAMGIEPEELGPFPREASGANPMPRDLLPAAFDIAPNAGTMVEREASFAVIQLREVHRADLSGEAEAVAATRTTAAQRMAEDLEVQFQQALRARADVRINPRLMDRVVGN